MRQIGRKVRQILSLVLAIVLIVTMIPQSALSVYGEELEEVVTTESGVDSEATTDVVAEAETDFDSEIEESEIESADADEVSDFELEEDIEEEETTEAQEAIEEDIVELQSEDSEEFHAEENFSEDEEIELCEDSIADVPDSKYEVCVGFSENWILFVDIPRSSLENVVNDAKEKNYQSFIEFEWGVDQPIAGFETVDDTGIYKKFKRSPLDEDDDFDFIDNLDLFGNDNLPSGECEVCAKCRYVYFSGDEIVATSNYSDLWTCKREFPPAEPLDLLDDIDIDPTPEYSFCTYSDGGAGLSIQLPAESINKLFEGAKSKSYDCWLSVVFESDIPLDVGYGNHYESCYEYICNGLLSENSGNTFSFELFKKNNIPEGYFNIKVKCRFEYTIHDELTQEAMSSYSEWWENRHAFKRSGVTIPAIDKTYGYDGIKYIYDGDKLSVSFRVPKSDYENISLEEGEILKLYFRYGTKAKNLKNSDSYYGEEFGIFEGYYAGWNAETVKDGSELRTEPKTVPKTGGRGGEFHNLEGDYITVTVPLFGHIDGDNPIDLPYDGYKDGIYLGLEYVIMDKADCPDQDYETIDWNKAFAGEYSAKLYKNPTTIVSLQYDADEVDAGIYEGDNKVEPYSVTEPSGDIPKTEYYALDKTVSYNFKSETNGSGYKINKIAYTAGKTKANWATSKSFSPVDGALIAVDSQAIYGAVLKNDTDTLSPDVKGVYNISYKDDISYQIIHANDAPKAPDKIVVKNGKTVIKEVTDITGDNSKNVFSLADTSTAYGKKVTVELFDGETAVVTLNVLVSTPITSVALQNKAVLSPVIGADEVTSAITVNSGADASKLNYKFFHYNEEGSIIFTEESEEPDFVSVSVSDGKLKVSASGNYPVGESAYIMLYDTENPLDPDEQVFTKNNNIFQIKTAAPAWTKKTPTVSLISATDLGFEFKVVAPSGVKFDDKYFVAVSLSSNKNTQKTLAQGLTINETVHYFPIAPDGSFPCVTLEAFNEAHSYGDGCMASMDATIYVVLAKNGVSPSGEDYVLAKTQAKKLTVSTKTPYYADKITLKKTAAASKLYAGEWDPTTENYKHVLVATIDFGKSATYTRAEDWEIANIDELSDQGITVEKSGSNGIAVTTTIEKTVKAGTYTIKVHTVPPAGGVPVTASVNITVLPTPSGYYIDGIAEHESGEGITVYRKPGTAVSYKINPVIYSQDGAVLKNVSINYELKKKKVDSSNPLDYIYEPVEGLSISKGTLKISKDFTKEDNCDYVFSFNDGRFFDTGYFNINIIEDNISPASFGFANAGVPEVFPDKTEMTLLEYSNLGWSEGINFESLPAQFGIEEMWTEDSLNAGFLLLDSSNNVISEDLIKSISIPNPAYIKKTGNITLSATTIDGTKLTKKIKIVADGAQVYNNLCIESGAVESESVLLEEGGVCKAIAGTRTTAEYLIYLANSSDTSVNTKNNISGDTLTVKGAKIIENNHGDFLKIVMTQKVATITHKHGKEKTTYTLQNDSFDLPVLKAKARKGDVVYSGVCDNSQEMRFDLTGDYTEANYVRVYSSNSAFNSYIVSGNFNVNENTVTLSIDPEASQNLKPGSYSFTMELYDDGGNVLCKPASLSLKISKLKKSFKFTNKYTMSMTDMASVNLSVTESGVYYYNPTVLYNANVKGSYDNSNNILNYLEFEGDGEIGTLKIKNGADLTGIKSLTGYVGYHVKYLDGTEEDRLEKVTVNIKNQIGKYSVTLNKKNNSPSGESVEIKDAKGNVCDVTAIKLTDSKKNSPYIEEIVVCGDDEPGFEGVIVVNCSDPADPLARLKKGTYKATAIAILENSAYVPQEDAENPGTYLPPTEEDFAKYGVEVTISIKVPSGTIYI